MLLAVFDLMSMPIYIIYLINAVNLRQEIHARQTNNPIALPIRRRTPPRNRLSGSRHQEQEVR